MPPQRPRRSPKAARSGCGKPSATALADAPSATRGRACRGARRDDGRAQTLRVTADRIDALVRLTGELTVAKNAIGHAVKLAENEGSALAVTLKNRHAALDRLVGELQRAVLGMRVLPLRTAFQRFPRLIREMSAELGKPATLAIEGEDTEADKAIVEILVEPLVHVLRNAMDHGIEPAAARAAAGKPAVATIRLRAFREGEHVSSKSRTTARGIDVAKVREVAKERNVVADAKTLAAMSDAEVARPDLRAGLFDGRPRSREVSGRGVGMDAVRTAVERLGGQVEVEQRAGQGNDGALHAAVQRAGDSGDDRRGRRADVRHSARRGRRNDPRSRGAHLPGRSRPRDRVARPHDSARAVGSGARGAGRTTRGGEAGPIVIARVDGDLGALQVDSVGERMDVMLKPLDGLLSGPAGYRGSTLLGDGSVLLVLDLAELLR